MTEFAADKTLDARGLKCPMPVVKTSQEIKNIEIGNVLEVLATDPGSIADINAWTKSTGNELLKMGKNDDVFQFFIKRVK
jgi:TusA-related sulfurtransferase